MRAGRDSEVEMTRKQRIQRLREEDIMRTGRDSEIERKS